MSHLPTPCRVLERTASLLIQPNYSLRTLFFCDRNIIKNKKRNIQILIPRSHWTNWVLFHLFEQEFTTIMYFRQYWMDKRLQYNNTGYSKRLAFNPQMLKFIWVPDTHFPGIKDGLKHDITDTNEVIRLWPNGSVLYSMRWVRTGYEHLFSRGGEVTWVNFCRVCASGLSEPLLYYSLFCSQI